MIDAAIATLGVKIIELLNIDRIRRRESLVEVLTPIYENLKEIHGEYLIELSTARNQCATEFGTLKEVLINLENKRLLKEPQRQEIIAASERLITRKWRPEVKKFLESINRYFKLSMPIITMVNYSSRSESEMRQMICWSTGYSRVIEVLKHFAGEKQDHEDTQRIVLEIFDETLESLRAAWFEIASDFAEIKIK